MFAFILDSHGGAGRGTILAMANALRGSAVPVEAWCDEHGRAALAAGNSGLLPQDVFARQPIVGDDLVFAAQARIDNRDEILKRLGVPLQQGATLADGAVLHLAYRRWGEDCVRELTGDYAFVAWHRDSGRVAAAVDHLGMARLYYAQSGGTLVLATQLGAVLAHPAVPRDLNFAALGLLIAPKLDADTTPYSAVHSLPGGHLIVQEVGVLRRRRWWNPDGEIRTRYRDPGDYVRHARTVLDDAVKACLRTTSGVAATVSGGLDSTLVAAAAALQLKQSGRRLRGYTAIPQPGLACQPFPGWESDDSRYALEFAGMHENLDLALVSAAGQCTLDILPSLHARSHTPVRNGANHLWMGRIYETAARDGARIVLLGIKGNATLSHTGDGALGAMLRTLRWRAALELATNDSRSGGMSVARALLREAAGWRVQDFVRRLKGGANRPGRNILSPPFRAAHEAELAEPFVAGSARERQVAFALSPAKQWSADPLPQWNVETRDPLADRRLIECLLGFPADAFAAGGRSRGLAREMGAGRVPDSIRFRRTKGDQAADAPAMIAAHAKAYRQALDKVTALSWLRTVVDVDYLQIMVNNLCEGRGSRADAFTVDRVFDVGLFVYESTQSPRAGR